MKHLLLFVTVLTAFSFTVKKTQVTDNLLLTDTGKYERKKVSIINWGSRAIYLSPAVYFKETKNDIISKIGEDKFNDVQFKCSASGWPDVMSESSLDNPELKTKMNKLKMYRIAVYQHIYNGNIFDKYAILEVPYAENADWDAAIKWERSIYFLLKETDVKLID